MTNKKLIWIVVPISFLLGGFVSQWLITPRVVETFNEFQGNTNIQNIKFRAERLREIQVHLDSEEYEQARELIIRMQETDIQHLNLMLDVDSYPEEIRLRASRALAEFESAEAINE